MVRTPGQTYRCGMAKTPSSTFGQRRRTANANRPAAIHTDGHALRELRYRKGLEVADLVQRLAALGFPVHADTVRNIELGHRNASAKLTKRLADALDVDPSAIMQKG